MIREYLSETPTKKTLRIATMIKHQSSKLTGMCNFLQTFIAWVLFTILLTSAAIAQPTWTSNQTGNWSTASTWTTTGGASGAPPTDLSSNQRVIITDGHVVTNINSILMEGTSTLTIQNGGELIMGNASNPAPTFTMKSSSNQFIMTNGIYESFAGGSGGNMLIEAGLVDWRGSTLYVSGNYTFKKDAFVTMINVCQRAAQNILFEGNNTSSNPAVLNNVLHIGGTSGTGNVTFKDTWANVTDIRIKVGSSSGTAEFFKTVMNGSIYSIYGKEKITVNSMSGTTTLEYYCATTLDPNLNYFGGSKIVDCPLAIAQDCGSGVSYSLAGTVYNNPNYPPITNGTPIGTAGTTQLYISLLDGANSIVGTVAVASNGSYSLPNLGPGNYKLVLHISPGGSSTPALPTDWYRTAEGITPNGDGTPDGIISITSLLTDVTTAHFGIRQEADLSIVKTVDNTSPTVGDNVTFTLTASNGGPSGPRA